MESAMSFSMRALNVEPFQTRGFLPILWNGSARQEVVSQRRFEVLKTNKLPLTTLHPRTLRTQVMSTM